MSRGLVCGLDLAGLDLAPASKIHPVTEMKSMSRFRHINLVVNLKPYCTAI